MLFSIVIPVYNAEKYLRRCVESVLSQTYPNFEIIIINDGSTDLSSNILEELSKNDARIKVYNFENSGVTKSRQRGVSLAKGDYILFVDSDDTINKDLLNNIRKVLYQFPDVEMVRFKAKMVNDLPGYDHELYNNDSPGYNIVLTGIEAVKEWSRPNKRYEIFWLYAIKKENLSILHDCPCLKTSGDYAFMPILIASCKKVTMIDYVGYNYTCDNHESLTHKQGHDKEKSRALNFIKAYCYLIEHMQQIEKRFNENLGFFYDDWRNRLLKKYSLLSETLKDELKADFERALKNQ